MRTLTQHRLDISVIAINMALTTRRHVGRPIWRWLCRHGWEIMAGIGWSAAVVYASRYYGVVVP